LARKPILVLEASEAKVARILGRLIFIVFAFVIVTGSANAYTLTSTEGHFTAVFPGEPKLTESTAKTTSGLPYSLSTWIFSSSDGSEGWFITMAIYKSTSVIKDYNANVSGAVAAVKGKLVSQKTIRQSGVEGREILIDIPGSQEARERLLWIGNRLYQIMYLGKAGTASTPDVDAFFNSFKATK
jgi:hypothetical protein